MRWALRALSALIATASVACSTSVPSPTPSLSSTPSPRLPVAGELIPFSFLQRFDAMQGSCRELAQADESVIACGTLGDQPENGIAYVVASVADRLRLSTWLPIGKDHRWSRNRIADFSPSQVSAIDVVIIASGGSRHLLVTYSIPNGPMQFDLLEADGRVTAHDQVIAVTPGDSALHVWRSPSEREDYEFAASASRTGMAQAPVPTGTTR